MSWYKAGTVQVTTGSAAVLGVGTQWVSKVKAGEALLGPDGALYEIQNVSSDFTLTLAAPYAGADATGVPYVIVPTQSYMRVLAGQVAELIALYSQVPEAAESALASVSATAASAAAALASKQAAAESETNAAASAADAWASNGSAASSASFADGRAGAASASASQAANSAADALASELAAKTSETNAAASASSADGSKAAAAQSASAAAASAASIAGGPVTSVNGHTGIAVLTAADVGLGNVANKAPADLPVSTAAQAALDLKADKTAVAGSLALKADLASSVQKTSNTGAASLPSGTTAQRTAPDEGNIRFNKEFKRYEGGNGTSWGSLGGATGGGNDDAFYENTNTITGVYVGTAGKNASSTGPMKFAEGSSYTIPEGSTWTVI